MKKQLEFIKVLFNDFEEDCAEYIKKKEKSIWSTLQNRNVGKTALKRKIVMLRQELMNLAKEIDEE